MPNVRPEIGRGISLGLRPTTTSSRDTEVVVFSMEGAPSDGILPDGQALATSQPAVCFRSDGTSATTMYVTVDGGTTWTAFDPAALSGLDLDGSALVIDADGDTTMSAAVDDVISWKIAGAVDFTFTANSLNILTGSVIDLADSCTVKYGTGDDITMTWDGSSFKVAQAAANSSIDWGVDGAGMDQIWYGDTAGSKMTWDQSADSLLFTDSTPITFGDGSDVTLQFDATNLVLATAVADTGALALGADGAGVDVIFYGDTAGSNITWDQSADSLLITDSTPVSFGDGGDLTLQFDATNLVLATAVADTGALALGASGAGVDVIFYGDTATYDVTWDQSADSMIFADNANLVFGTGSDDTIVFDGTNMTWTHTDGLLTIDNQDVNSNTILRLGVDTNAQAVAVHNNSDTAVHTINAAGNVIVAPTTIDMANAEHTMVLTGAGANQTDIAGPVWFCDPNGGSVTLVLPAEASCTGMMMMVVNTADAAEAVTIQDDAKGYTVIVLDQNQAGWIACDGTTWYGFMGAET